MARNPEKSAEGKLYFLSVLPDAQDMGLYKKIVSLNLCFDGTLVELPVNENWYEIKGEGRTFLHNLPLLFHGRRAGSLIDLYVYHLSGEITQSEERRPLQGHFQKEDISGQYLGKISDGRSISANTRCQIIPIPRHNPADFLR
ncbi:MAG: hypothetical protein Q7R43_05190 [Candidatus Daviesbacteria bacterium]|nr:hypothetical protein [Candidatus Daviesbacteria bacterium]